MEPQAEAEPTWIDLAGQKEEIDLFLVCDSTVSMTTYLPALKVSLRQVFLVAKLLYHGRLMVHIVSYRDYYNGKDLLSAVSRRVVRNDAIVKFEKRLSAMTTPPKRSKLHSTMSS
ncbi:hypothetical protein Ae201684P_009446 [Aphanomyces euteiches]|uniref:Uncharacterized protein n=1 Tax=Aphanomyces euteiches TaxID=100861 RepID=A0A6G0WL25_9STRA|nr:hypothetical protein Ae201684_014103 [Aphanomyces euteiches]KAH9096210.1 hypothetical protein Ae201684P_009446 [Aphanomyces euteiches]